MVNNPNKIIIHCADTPDNREVDIEAVRSWHTLPPPKGRGWSDVGYHYFIKKDGIIQIGRLETEIGAHVRGVNTNSLGICLAGRSSFNREQYHSLERLYKDLYLRHDIKPRDVYGHYEFTKDKTCPNINMDILRTKLYEAIKIYLS